MKGWERGKEMKQKSLGVGRHLHRGGGVNRGGGFMGTGPRVLGKGSLLGERWAMALEKETINN